MGNRKKNKQKNRQNPNVNTNPNIKVLNTEAEKKETDTTTTSEVQTETTEEEQKNGKADVWKKAGQEKTELAFDNKVRQDESGKEAQKAFVSQEHFKVKLEKKEALKKAEADRTTAETTEIKVKDTVNQEYTNREIFNQENTDIDIIDNESTEQEYRETVDKEIINQEITDADYSNNANQETADEEIADIVDIETVDEEIAELETANEEILDIETIDEEIVELETVNEETVSKENANKEITNKGIDKKEAKNKDTQNKKTENKKSDNKELAKEKNKDSANKDTVNKAIENKDKKNKNKKEVTKEFTITDTASKERPKENKHKQSASKEASKKEIAQNHSSEQTKEVIISAVKVLLPVAACAIVIAAVISFVSSRRSQTVVLNTETSSDTQATVTLSEQPLAENAHTDVNELMRTFYTALADGDMDTVRALKDYNTDREIITYEKKSEFIESYDNVNCYTKPGIEDNSYFVYATYDVKIKDIATEAPGLNAFYVYTADDGSLKIDGDTEENIKAAFKLVTSQDDVVDLYNKIDVNYNEATASDEALDQFMTDLPKVIKESVSVALAELETQDENTEPAQTQEPPSTETQTESGQPLQNQVVNQIVRTTDTVNVRSSDSEEADKIGKAQAGTELRRIEERINGWSKVIFEDKEAYIKSDYLEVVSTEVAEEQPVGTVTATTNVNVRSQASQESERLGSAPAGSSYNLIEDQGEWYKIDYNGTTGYVKAEFFTR